MSTFLCVEKNKGHMYTKFAGLLLSLLLTSIGFTQGIIKGKVTDAISGESIPGIKISVEGTDSKALSDLDGHFVFDDIKTGTYSISFSYNNYNTKIVTDVIVKNAETTELVVAMEAVVKEIGLVTIRVKIDKESNENLIILQRNSAGMVDGITAENIRRSPDRAASDVLKRVSGASIQDNKFVIIRGLYDRYNTAMINGLPLPSTEADRKAFSFDIFPSVMLDNMLIFKTASPDLPGDFAGGVIQINTKDVPEKDFISVTAGTNFNTQSTFKEYSTYQGSSKDWIGLGASDRALPSGMLSTSKFKLLLSDPNTVLENSKNFTNDWGIDTKKSSP